jgi:hypothetical protein
MEHLEIVTWYGEEKKTVVVTQPNSASGTFQILIDRYYHGQITRYNGKWIAYLNSKSDLTSNDLLILFNLLTELLPAKH